MPLMSQDDDKIVMQGPDGQPVTVAKSALSQDALARFYKSNMAMAPGAPVSGEISDDDVTSKMAAEDAQNKNLQAQDAASNVASQQLLQDRIKQDTGMDVSLPGTTVPQTSGAAGGEFGALKGTSPLLNPPGSSAASSPQTPADSSASATAQKPQGDYLDAGIGREKTAITNIAQHAQEQGLRDQNYVDGMQKAAVANQQQMQVEAAERKRQADDFATKLAQNDKDLAANAPKNYWADKSTGSKIGAAIAIGLGAYASAYTGGPNGALQIINDAIKRDVDLQAAKRANIKDQRGNIQSAYQMKMQQLGDDSAARQGAYVQGLEVAKLQLQKSAMTAQTQNAKDNAGMMIGQIEHQQGVLRAEMAMKHVTVMNEMNKRVVPGLGVNGKPVYAATPEDATEAKTKLAAHQEFSKIVNGLIEERKANGPVFLDRDKVAEGQAKIAALVPLMNEMSGLTRLSKDDIELMQKQIGDDPTKIGAVIAKLNAAKENADSKIGAFLRQRGLPGIPQSGQIGPGRE